MHKLAKTLLLMALLVSLLGMISLPSHAEDLPIDAEIIRQQQLPDGAITDHFDIDLFNARAERISQAVAKVRLAEQTKTKNSLFLRQSQHEPVNIPMQLVPQAIQSGLFMKPADYSKVKTNALTNDLPIWLIIVVLVVFAGGGLALSFGLRNRKRRQDADVH